ncbi:MFS transporter [Bacillus solitudinis]|uniref:MFS transporter n=1 Tax=Bacillus solitudinis TaxID=2014074 RepID=UPI000C24FAA8|nr:MFS transporter [Bacillus solitudinis]
MVRFSMFYFVLYSSFAAIFMFVPLYLQAQGLTKDEIGFIMAMGSVIAVFGQPIWGYASDKVQSTRFVLLLVMVCALLSSFFLFSVHTYLSLVLLFTLFMFFMTSCGPLTDSMAMQFALKNNKNYGLMRAFGSIGVGTSALFLGILIGGVGINYLGWIYAAIMIAAIPLVFFVRESGREKRDASKPRLSLHSIKTLLRNKQYISILLVSMIIFTPHKMNDSLFTIYLADLGANEQQIGLSWMLATFSSVPLFSLTGVLLKRYSELVLMLVASCLFSVRWFLYGFWDQPEVLTFLQLMQGVTFPLFFVAVFHYVTQLIPREFVATGQMLFIAATIGLGGLIGNAGGGWFMEFVSPQATYQFAGMLSMIGALLIGLTLIRRESQDRGPSAPTTKNHS